MRTNKHLLAIATLTATALVTQVQAASPHCRGGNTPTHRNATISTGVVYKVVQRTPQYDVRRAEVVSGARVTLFAPFLRQESGCVLFNLNGTSTECTLVDWQANSVTVELPRLGLTSPKNAEIQIVLPDGRIAKTFPVLFISQPDIVIHEDTIPQPMPPAPAARPASYVTPVQGGILLQAGG